MTAPFSITSTWRIKWQVFRERYHSRYRDGACRVVSEGRGVESASFGELHIALCKPGLQAASKLSESDVEMHTVFSNERELMKDIVPG